MMLVFWDEEALCEADAAAKFFNSGRLDWGNVFLITWQRQYQGLHVITVSTDKERVTSENVSCHIFLMVLFTEYRLIRFKSLQSCIYGKSRVIGSIGFDL